MTVVAPVATLHCQVCSDSMQAPLELRSMQVEVKGLQPWFCSVWQSLVLCAEMQV